MNVFKNPLDPENIEIKKAIQKWVIERFKLENSVQIEIIEHRCTEASCVHAETIITVSSASGTEGGAFYKIAKPLVFIRKIDIALMQKIEAKPKRHQH
jgi:hypothetical protein